ncbi:MAG: ester cyclase, partial [Frankiaceae bacterium]
MTQSDLSGQAQAYIEAVNRGDWDAAVQFLSPEVLLVDYSSGGTHRGREAWVARFKPFTEAFPDGRLELASAVTEGRRMAQEVVVRGTHTAPLSLPTGETMPATGRSVELHFAAVWEADNDQRVAVAHFYA